MKKLVNISLFYAVAAMAGGVFFREITRFTDFEGSTSLGVVHTHLFLLGMFFFLLLLLLDRKFGLSSRRGFGKFLWIYNAGLVITTAGLIWRGITQVMGMQISIGIDTLISIVSGIGHILLGIGIIVFFVLLKRQISGVPVKKKK